MNKHLQMRMSSGLKKTCEESELGGTGRIKLEHMGRERWMMVDRMERVRQRWMDWDQSTHTHRMNEWPKGGNFTDGLNKAAGVLKNQVKKEEELRG